MENANSKDYLEKIKIQVIENLKKTAHAPSVQMTDVPRTTIMGGTDEDDAELDDLDEDENKDTRDTKRRWDQRITRDDELDESEDEEEARANGVRPQNGVAKRRNIMDYQNSNTVASDVEMDSGIATPEIANEVDDAVTAAATVANAEVNAELMKQKTLNASAETGELGPSNAPSRGQSPKAKVDNEGDIDMTEPAAQPEAKTSTPVAETALSPTAAVARATSAASSIAAAPTEAVTESRDTTEVKQEDEAERQDADITAKASTEIGQQSQP
jgi:histone deacetylase 1/2